MSNLFIYDDIISEEYQNFLENIFVKQAGMYWAISPDLNSPPNLANFDGIDCFVDMTSNIRKTYGLIRQPISRGKESDPVLSILLKSFIYAITDRIDVKVSKINTARAFLQLPWTSPEQDKFHVDDIEPHMVLLYYVNDSDGDTLISDKEFTGAEPDYGVDANIIERISPKKGRAILFDGHTYHAASVPKNNLRCVLNFNLT
jgi:hypothetical protein